MKIWAFEMNGREQRAYVPRKDEKLDYALKGHGLLYRYEGHEAGRRAGFKAYEAPHRRQLAQMFQALRAMGEKPHQLHKKEL